MLLWDFCRAVVGPMPPMAVILTTQQVSLHFSPFFSIVVIKILSRNPQFKAKYKILLLSQLGMHLRHQVNLSDLLFTVLV